MTMTAVAADVLIIGAGSAGCVLASRLTEDADFNVCLVEAGNEVADPQISDPAAWPLLQGSEVDWTFETTPQSGTAGRAHAWPRGRVVGGSSAIHAMGHMRGHPADFDAWHDAGATGWTWEALLPFFMRSETSPFAGWPGYGADGPITLMQPETPHPLTEAHREAGALLGLTPIRDHNGSKMDGPTLNTLTIEGGRRQSVSDAYLTPVVRGRPNLDILTSLEIDQLLFDSDDRVHGICGRRHGRSEQIFTNAIVVLAAGAIGTPSILLRSGIGPGDDLSKIGVTVRHDMPGVGQNLQDHLLSAGNVYRASQTVPMTTTQHSESLTYIHSKSQDPHEAPALVVGIVTVPVVSELLASTITMPKVGEAYTLMFGITHPVSRGKLWLNSPAPGEKPLIDPGYLTAEEDRKSFLEALAFAQALGGSAAYDDWRDTELLPCAADLATPTTRLAFIERAAYSHHHPIGTCRMGSDPMAVVTPDLRVAPVPGLFVVDGSILPSLTTGPVNAAVVAVAERGSDTIRRFLHDGTW